MTQMKNNRWAESKPAQALDDLALVLQQMEQFEYLHTQHLSDNQKREWKVLCQEMENLWNDQ